MRFEFIAVDSGLPEVKTMWRNLLRMKISNTAKILYLYLLDHSTADPYVDAEGFVYLKIPIITMAAAIYKSPMTIKRAIQELEDYGLLEKYHGGAGRVNKLYIRIQTDGIDWWNL